MRTDVQLRRDVIDEMSGESTLRVDQIGVEVRDGIVFLTGQVDNFAQRSAAEGGGVSSHRAKGDGDGPAHQAFLPSAQRRDLGK